MAKIYKKIFFIIIVISAIFPLAFSANTLANSRPKMQADNAKQLKHNITSPLQYLKNAKQLLLVITPDNLTSHNTKIFFYDKKPHNNAWVLRYQNIAGVIGKNGAAYDRQQPMFAQPNAIYKREGDNKTPIGIYPIRLVFGFSDNTLNPKMKYIKITDTTEAVDDIHSKFYNQIIDAKKVSNDDWNTSEKMREITLYKMGLAIGHNEKHIPGDGSNIFIHIWRSKNTGTAGCIAMSEKNIAKIVTSLNAHQLPVVMIVPKLIFSQHYRQWHLPKV